MLYLAKPAKKVLGLLFAMMLLLLLFFALFPSGKAAAFGKAISDDDMGRQAFLEEYGWVISTVPLEVCDVVIPETFNAVYTRYNDLQKSQGFDLEHYKGKTVKRYTYEVVNYPQAVGQVRADLLVYQGQVIGGDIATVAIDGFMHGLDKESAGLPCMAVGGIL